MKNYIVFDLEWNQSIEGKEHSIEHFPFEIIEIGAVKRADNAEGLCGAAQHDTGSDPYGHGDIEAGGEIIPGGHKRIFRMVRSRLPFLHLGSDGPDGAAAEYGVLPGGDPI